MGLCATLLLGLLPVSAGPEPAAPIARRVLLPLPDERVEIGAWLKQHGWSSKRNSPRRFTIEGGRMHLVSDDDSVLIGTKAGFPLDPAEWPRVRFRLRVDELPRGTDLTRKRGDDAAFRLYVAFDEGGTWVSPPNTIAYTWTEDLAPETLLRSPHYKRLRYLSVGQGPTLGAAAADEDGWVTIERDLARDYRRVFGARGEVPRLVGFMLKCDANNTGTTASTRLEGLELLGPEPAARGR